MSLPSRRFLRLSCLVLFIALFHSLNVWSKEVLTWEKSVGLAKGSNAELKASENSLSAAEFSLDAAKSGYFPQVTGTLSYAHGANSSNSGSNGGLGISTSETGTSTSFVSSLTATENLFNGFQDRAKQEQALAHKKAAQASLRQVQAKVSFELKSAFAGMIYSQELIELMNSIIRIRESNLKLVQLRYESGREDLGALQLSKAYLDQAKFESHQALHSQSLAQMQLAKVLNFDFNSDFNERIEVQGAIPRSRPDQSSLAAAKEIVMSTPEYQLSHAQIEVAKAQMSLSEGGLFPTFSVSGTTGTVGSDWYPDKAKWSVGATLTIPFFNGGKDYFAIKSAGASLRAATFNHDVALRQGLVRLREALANYLEAEEKVQVDLVFLKALTTREKIAREKYNNGLLSFDDWNLIGNDLIAKQKMLILSTKDRSIAASAWEQVQGRGVFQ